MTAAPRARTVAVVVGVAYALGYLYALGDLSAAPRPLWALQVGDPELWLDPRGVFQFEAVAMVSAGHLVWLVSPLNIVVAAALGGLLAVNIDGAWELWRRPTACGLAGGSSGFVAAVPALVAGGACCAPSILLLLGIPSLGAFAALFGWLVPLSLVLLAASRWWQRRQGAPPWRRPAAA